MEVEFFHKGFMPLPPFNQGILLGIMEIKLLPVLSWTRGVSDTGEIIKADTMSCMGSPLDTH